MISIELEDGVTPYLNIVTDRLSDLSVPLTAILEDGLFSAQQQVVVGKGSAFGGAAWAPMAPSTAKRRNPATLLVDTGALLMSLGRSGPGNLFIVGPDAGEAGTGIEYAGWQQDGTSRIPPRPYLVWYSDRMSDYDQLMLDWAMPEAAVA